MPQILTLVSPTQNSHFPGLIEDFTQKLKSAGTEFSDVDWLSADRACEFSVSGIEASELAQFISTHLPNTDFALQANGNRRKKLLLADMDSTMIQLESLDSLAAELGFGEEVEAITERGMRGELDFRDSLRTRVALLEGQATDAMAKILENIPYTEGAEVTVKTMAAHGCYCALVSGGFTFTTEVVYKKLGFQEHRANEFEIIDGRLTGKVIEPILGRDSKKSTLLELIKALDINLEESLAIGDGANDLDMLEAAGMGVGYHGKPIVQERAPFNIRFGDMTTLLYYQGYRDEDFQSL